MDGTRTRPRTVHPRQNAHRSDLSALNSKEMTTASIQITTHTTIHSIAEAMGILLGCPQKMVCIGPDTYSRAFGISIFPYPEQKRGQIVFHRAFVSGYPYADLVVGWEESEHDFTMMIPAEGLWLAVGSKLIEVFGGVLLYDISNPTAYSQTCLLSFEPSELRTFESWTYFNHAVRQLQAITDRDIETMSGFAQGYVPVF